LLLAACYALGLMNTATFPPESPALLTAGLPEFNIVMIYEDAAAGRRAKRFSDRLLCEIGDQHHCVRNLWSFDVLSLTGVRNAAAGIARAADLVVVSVSGDRAFTPKVEEWLELWAWMIDGSAPALVALFENKEGEFTPRIREKLKALARDKQLEFFPHATSKPSASFVNVELERLAGASRWFAE